MCIGLGRILDLKWVFNKPLLFYSNYCCFIFCFKWLLFLTFYLLKHLFRVPYFVDPTISLVSQTSSSPLNNILMLTCAYVHDISKFPVLQAYACLPSHFKAIHFCKHLQTHSFLQTLKKKSTAIKYWLMTTLL